jgi:ubiquinone biosynthesis UbiH/UbiF/VisC/COQ6 family hydroxylase
MSTRRREIFDFVVIGDGPVGLLSALKLHLQGKHVALMAPKPNVLVAEAANLAPDLRVYALAPDCLTLLQSVLDWRKLRTKAYKAMQVFEQDVEHALEFDAHSYGWDALGEIVEHTPLCQLLTQALVEAGAYWIDARANAMEVQDGLAILHSDTQTLRTRFVIDASGAQSILRTQAAIVQRTHAYAQAAVISNIQVQGTAKHDTAWQRFTEHGTIALLPLFDSSYALVYSALQDKADQLMQQTDAALLAELQSHFGDRAGRFVGVGRRLRIELHRALANKYIQGPLILIGDSAHVVHPLAGQGLNMGFRDLLCLLSIIEKAETTDRLAQYLPRYERERKSENAITAFAIEGLQKLFLPQAGPLRLLRSAGLRAVQNIAPMKRLFAELAAGKIAW